MGFKRMQYDTYIRIHVHDTCTHAIVCLAMYNEGMYGSVTRANEIYVSIYNLLLHTLTQSTYVCDLTVKCMCITFNVYCVSRTHTTRTEIINVFYMYNVLLQVTLIKLRKSS